MAGGAGNPESQFRARCSRCGDSVLQLPDRLDLGADLACAACGHRGKLVEFADLATLEAILEALKRRTVQALGGTAAASAGN